MPEGGLFGGGSIFSALGTRTSSERPNTVTASGLLQGSGTDRFAAVTEANLPIGQMLDPQLLTEEDKIRKRMGLEPGDIIAAETPFDEAATGPGGLGRGLPEEFIERNQEALESIAEGPQSEADIDRRRPILERITSAGAQVARDVGQGVVDALPGDPRGAKGRVRGAIAGPIIEAAVGALPDAAEGVVRDAVSARTGTFNPNTSSLPGPVAQGLEVASDIFAAAQGGALPSAVNRAEEDEPGLSEKILSPIADVSGALRGRGLPSRQAKLERARQVQRAREIELSAVTSGFKIYSDIIDQSRGLPPASRGPFLDAASELIEDQFGTGFSSLLQLEKQAAGSFPAQLSEALEDSPRLDLLFRSEGFAGLQKALGRDDVLKEVQQGADRRRFATIQRKLDEGLKFVQARNPGAAIDINRDGFKSAGEVERFNRELPEGRNGFRLTDRELATLFRNPAAFPGFLDDPKFVEEARKKEKQTFEEIKRSRAQSAEIAKRDRASVRTAGAKAQATERGKLEAQRDRFETFVDPETGVRIQRDTITGKESVAPTQKPLSVRLPDGGTGLSFDNGQSVLVDGQLLPISSLPGAQVLSSSRSTTAAKPPKAVENAREAAVAAANATTFLRKIRRNRAEGKTPFGPFGQAAVPVAGLLGALSPAAGEFASEALTGMGSAELASLKAEAAAFSAQAIPVFTGEEGARKTTFEQKLAAVKSRLENPATNYAQVVGAMQYIAGQHMLNMDSEAIRGGLAVDFDLGTEVGIGQLAVELNRLGFQPGPAAEMIETFIAQREALRKTGLDVTIREGDTTDVSAESPGQE